MSLEENDDVSPTDHFAIGISFGNSNSSIAHTNTVRFSHTIEISSTTDDILLGRKSRSNSERRRRYDTGSHWIKIRALKLTLDNLDRQIPSILSYVKGEEYHGTQAKSQLVRNAENTIAYFRDFIGKE